MVFAGHLSLGSGTTKERWMYRAVAQGSVTESFVKVSWGIADVHRLQQRLETVWHDGCGLRGVIHRVYMMPGWIPRLDQSSSHPAESD